MSILKLKLNSLMNRYKLLCDQYSDLALNCSAPGILHAADGSYCSASFCILLAFIDVCPSVLTVINCTECPLGWLHVEDSCFFFSTEKLDWLSSIEKCKEIGGHLAMLTTKEQHVSLSA